MTTSVDVAYATAGSTVVYTVTATNAGATNYAAATWTDSLTGLIDDAVYNGNAAASSGTVTLIGSNLRWTGALAVGASATVTFSATVRAAPGDNLLTTAITSTSSGNNCTTGNSDPRCTVTTPVARLILQQAYTETSTTPGSLVHLDATFTNTGQYPYTGITINASSAGTVDDATPTGDQVASSGTLTLTASQISWTGNIPVGATITITGTLTVQNPDTGDRVLTGTLTSTAPGNNCPVGTADSRCTANLPVLLPQLTLTKSANATRWARAGSSATRSRSPTPARRPTPGPRSPTRSSACSTTPPTTRNASATTGHPQLRRAGPDLDRKSGRRGRRDDHLHRHRPRRRDRW